MTLMLMALFLPVIGSASLLAAGAAGVYYATYAVRSQWLGQTDWHGRRDTAAVSLTFDDGPSHDTERILDILRDYNLRAAFFMIASHVECFPHTAQRAASCGHEVGNHSYSHPIYLYRSPRETRRQLEHAQTIITGTTGVQPVLARPPCGVRTLAYFTAARRLGLRTVQWDVAGYDWKKRSARQIADAVLHRAGAGSIILLHDGDSEGKGDRRETVAALPLIIEGLMERGLSIVSLAELLEAPGSESQFIGEINS